MIIAETTSVTTVARPTVLEVSKIMWIKWPQQELLDKAKQKICSFPVARPTLTFFIVISKFIFSLYK